MGIPLRHARRLVHRQLFFAALACGADIGNPPAAAVFTPECSVSFFSLWHLFPFDLNFDVFSVLCYHLPLIICPRAASRSFG